MEQGRSVDGLLQVSFAFESFQHKLIIIIYLEHIQVRVDRIQSDLESLEKALSERCKQHGVHVKATTTIELPFGTHLYLTHYLCYFLFFWLLRTRVEIRAIIELKDADCV